MADIDLRLHGPSRCNAETCCPSCSVSISFSLNGPPPYFPSPDFEVICPACHCLMTAAVIGWRLNPTGEAPAIESYASAHQISKLERSLTLGER
jgi:hypothetical protein